MKTDLQFEETLVRPGVSPTGRVSHHYGDAIVVAEGKPDDGATLEFALPESDGVGQAGLRAFQHRQSDEFLTAKENRPHNGVSWDHGEGGLLPPSHPHGQEPEAALAMENAGTPTSSRLTGKVAVGVIIVSGPGDLAFTSDEIIKVHAEVQNGLSWLGAQAGVMEPIQFHYDLQDVYLDLPDDPDAPDNEKEAYWLNPTMADLGYSNPEAYVQQLRSDLSTDWAYAAFFVKYSQSWFAYAYPGGPYLCMEYSNDGWGPDNIDRVYAHESGHIFNAPDEYSNANCSCTSEHGIYDVINGNCETCATDPVDCIMKGNSWEMCSYTPWHLGYLNLNSMEILSVQFPNVYLRMDGNGVTTPTGPGGGTVNCQYTAASYEKFDLQLQDDDNSQKDGTFAIASIQFPGVYLRMDGNGVTQPTGPGGGTVNCQYTPPGTYEKFRLAPQTDGTVAIASVEFSGVFLRMDGNGVTQPTGPGGGTVNCQYTPPGTYERFRLGTGSSST